MPSKYTLAARQIAKIFSDFELTYDESRKVVQGARKLCGIAHETKPQTLPEMPTREQLAKFWQVVETRNIRDMIMLKLAYLTGCRNAELCCIKPELIDLQENKIFIVKGKGGKDRYVLFEDSFALVLRMYLATLGPKPYWLFPGQQGSHITARTFQRVAERATKASGISTKIHPHKLRHLLLTHLTEQGMPDAQIQLISGHASRESLKVYQHVALPGVKKAYQKAMKEGKED